MKTVRRVMIHYFSGGFQRYGQAERRPVSPLSTSMEPQPRVTVYPPAYVFI
ncbi:MAG: hypothetical protein LBH77_05770 [Tannerella sp.]|nr:hypothetical protein [Tannerella sp.]